LKQAAIVDFGAFALVHHDGNADTVRAWDAYRATIADPQSLLRIPATEVIEAVAGALASGAILRHWLLERYCLPWRTP
jgi:hypothetical protein